MVYLAWERWYRDWLDRRYVSLHNDYAAEVPLQKFDSDARRKPALDNFVGAVLTGISRVIGRRYSLSWDSARDSPRSSFVRPVRPYLRRVHFAREPAR